MIIFAVLAVLFFIAFLWILLFCSRQSRGFNRFFPVFFLKTYKNPIKSHKTPLKTCLFDTFPHKAISFENFFLGQVQKLRWAVVGELAADQSSLGGVEFCLRFFVGFIWFFIGFYRVLWWFYSFALLQVFPHLLPWFCLR